MSFNAQLADSFASFLKNIQSVQDMKMLTVRVRNNLLDMFDVDMATIYMVDPGNKLLASWILLPGESVRRICIPKNNASISGYVANTGTKLLVRDVYNARELMQIDPELRFDSSWDVKTGSRTRQILSVPISTGKAVIGVIQLINKRNAADFHEEDIKNCEQLANTLGRLVAKIRHGKEDKKTNKYDKLIDDNIITQQMLERAIAIAGEKETDVESVLLETFHISKNKLGNALAEFYNTDFIDLNLSDHTPGDFLKGINIEYFRNSYLVPIKINDNKVTVASDNPADQSKVPEIMQVLRVNQAEILFAFKFDIDAYINKLKGITLVQKNEKTESMRAILDKISEDEAVFEAAAETRIDTSVTDSRPVVMLVRKIIEDAYQQNASDIHIEPYGGEKDAEVRFRIDGVCKNVLTIPRGHIKAVIARFKVLADLDISERRKPQDGKIKMRTSDNKDIELRVATLPTANDNEDMVLRVLADSKPYPLNEIMPQHIFEPFAEIIKKPYGIVLVVGPTGSGKTTTLHSALNHINTPEKKIWTAEDPVEITQYRLRQLQVRPKIGLTFAAAMRAFLRADPDIIMVGEMRDQETARTGIEASLTGHLVFSTLHTNSAAETIVRLLDMGIDTFNFADSMQAILAQRLLRKLCPHCKEAYHPKKEEYEHLLETYGVFFFDHLHKTYTDNLMLYQPKGCEKCNDTGYKGRRGVFELLIADASIRKQIVERAPVDIIKQEAINQGMTTLMQEGIKLVFDGETDFNQVLSVCAL